MEPFDYFDERGGGGGGGPESGLRTTTTTALRRYYTKSTRLRLAQEEEERNGNRQDQYTAAPQEMRPEALPILPKAATANSTNKNDSYPFDYNYGGGGGSGGSGQIKMGCLYELNHSLQLSDQSSLPVQLKSVRVVMVIAKSEVDVILRFPSATSLRTHFNNTNVLVCDDQQPQLMKKKKPRVPPQLDEEYAMSLQLVPPQLDEEYAMSLQLAGKLLIRQILSSEFSKQKHLRSFWTPTFQLPISSVPVQDHSETNDYHVSDDDNGAQVARSGLNGDTENWQSMGKRGASLMRKKTNNLFKRTSPQSFVTRDEISFYKLVQKLRELALKTETRVGRLTTGGTFHMGLPHNDMVFIGGESRTTYKRKRCKMINKSLVEFEFKEMKTEYENGRLCETRSVKIDLIHDFLSAAAGCRPFNVEMKKVWRRDLLLNPDSAEYAGFGSYETAEYCRKLLKEHLDKLVGGVKKKYKGLSEEELTAKIKEVEDTHSAFISGMIDKGRPKVYKFSICDTIASPVESCEPGKYMFCGSVGPKTQRTLENFLDRNVKPATTSTDVMRAVLRCIEHATKVSEKSKKGDASVGGWAEGWTMATRDKHEYLKSSANFPCRIMSQVRIGDIVVVQYDLGRIGNSAPLGSSKYYNFF